MNIFIRVNVFLIVFLIVCPGCNVAFARAQVGLDTNAPIISSTGDIAAPPQVVAETGTTWVRVNFILGPWNSPGDTTLHGSHNGTWFETYDQIVDGFVSRGVKVYGLIGGEAVKSTSGLNTDDYVNAYVANFAAIVDHYKDRIRVFESFNEPNDWAGGSTAQVQPYWFARMLEQIYRAVKINNGHWENPDWQVTLVSGPLFTHDLDNGASYTNSYYQEGINNLGWTDLLTNYGTYPLDGIGFHIYVSQGTTDVATITGKMQGNLNATWNVVTSWEGAQTPKKFWVSEFGWNSDHVGSEANQALNVTTGFNVLFADQRVALATWFSLTDFPGGAWGLFRQGGLIEANKKPSWQVFHDIAVANPPEPTPVPTQTPVPTPSYTPGPTPTITPTSAPTPVPTVSPTPAIWGAELELKNFQQEMKAGSTQTITLSVRNTGTMAWNGAGESNQVRVIASGVSPENEYEWLGFEHGGMYLSPTEAQAYLGESVAPTGETELSFVLGAPAWSGAFSFAAQVWQSQEDLSLGLPLQKYILVQKDSENALTNGGWEDGNLTGWTEWGQTDGAQSGPWFAGIEAKEGDYFFGAAANYGQKNGGVYQQFYPVTSESIYGARVFVQTYQEGGVELDAACRLGLDPQGGSNPAGGSIVWSDWEESHGEWTSLYQFVRPEGNQISLFLEFRQKAPVWNVTCFDEALLLPVNMRLPDSWTLR